MATREQLISNIRGKYPEYDDLSDDQLATSVANKYPEYAEELQVSVSRIPQPITLPEEAAFTERFISEAQAPTLTRAGRALGQLGAVVPALAGTLAGGVSGLGEIFGGATVAPTTPRGLREAVSEAVVRGAFPLIGQIPGVSGTISRAAPALAQTALEVVPREAFNVLELGRQLGRFGTEEPERLAQLGIAGLTGGPVGAIVEALRSRTPSTEEASRAFERQLASQASQEVAAEPIAPEVFGEANIPLAQAIPVAAGAVPLVGAVPAIARAGTGLVGEAFQAIAAPIQKAVSRGFRTPTIEKATGLVGVTESEGLLEILNVATPRIIQKSGSTPRNAKEAIQAANQAEKGLIDEAKGFLQTAEERGLAMKGNVAIERARANLQERHPSLTADQIDEVLTEYDFLSGDINPTQGQRFLVEQNDKLTAFRQKEGISARAARANPEITARLAVADTLSEQLDDLVKVASGKNSSPYRDWGQVREFKSGIQDSVSRAERALGRDAIPASGGEETVVPLTRFGAAGRVLRRVSRPIRKQATEFVDDAVNSVFKDSRKTFSEPELPPETLSSLERQYVRSATPPAPAATAVAVPTFEEQIQALIKTYPASLKRDPRLARLAAEAELTQAAAPAVVQPVVPATAPSQSLQQAISDASLFPTRPSQTTTVLPRVPLPQELYQEMLKAIERGDIFTAQKISDQLKGL